MRSALFAFLQTAATRPGRGLIVYLLGSGLLSTVAGSTGMPAWAAAILFAILACLGFVVAAGAQLQHRLDSGAVFRFDDPEVEYQLLKSGTPPEWGYVAYLPVANDPPNRLEASRATDVYADLTHYTMDGTELFRLSGHWSDGGPRHRDFAPNGSAVALDLAFKADPFDQHSYAVGMPERKYEGEIWQIAKRDDRKLGERAHYCLVHVDGVGIATNSGRQWLRIRNGGEADPLGLELIAERCDAPEWASR